MITIKSVHIRNFRSIVDETINLTDFNCFVGKNDSGKSNVLKALNLFFNGETDFNTAFDFKSDYPMQYLLSLGLGYIFLLCFRLSLPLKHNILLPKNVGCRIYTLNLHVCRTSSAHFSLSSIP